MLGNWYHDGGSVTVQAASEANQHRGTGISPVIISKTKEQTRGTLATRRGFTIGRLTRLKFAATRRFQ